MFYVIFLNGVFSSRYMEYFFKKGIWNTFSKKQSKIKSLDSEGTAWEARAPTGRDRTARAG